MESIVMEAEEVSEALIRLTTQLMGRPDCIELVKNTLRVPLCVATKLIVPDARQKIDEYQVASRHGLIVSNNQNGPDAYKDRTDGKRELWEIKSCLLTKHNRCNPCWPVPELLKTDGDTVTKRSKLVQSIADKTLHGGAIVVIKKEDGTFVKEYNLTSAFLVTYFTHVPIKARTQTINMGSTMCNKCQTFHRLDMMQKLSDEGTAFDGTHQIFRKIPGQCSLTMGED
jgi:hypothetical protein